MIEERYKIFGTLANLELSLYYAPRSSDWTVFLTHERRVLWSMRFTQEYLAREQVEALQSAFNLMMEA